MICSFQGIGELECENAKQMYSDVLMIIYNLGILGPAEAEEQELPGWENGPGLHTAPTSDWLHLRQDCQPSWACSAHLPIPLTLGYNHTDVT